jgi:type III restriction enzyme
MKNLESVPAAEHFKELYENVTFDAFVYDSSKLSDVRNFATSPDIQIMVMQGLLNFLT